MNDYQKLATIVMRALACYLLLIVIIEWAIIGAGTLLITLGLFPRFFINVEVRLVTSFVYLVAGLILYYRSEALASRIIAGLTSE